MKWRILWSALLISTLSYSPVALHAAETTKTATSAAKASGSTATRAKVTKATGTKSTAAKPAVTKSTPKRKKTRKSTTSAAKPSAAKETAKASSKATAKADSKETTSKSSTSGENKTSSASSSGSRKVVVKAVKTTLRSKADPAGKALGVLTQYMPVEVVDNTGAWKKVKTSTGVAGYVDASALSANNYVSTGRSKVYVRSGPSINDTAIFSLQACYPLRIVDKSGDRVRVVDCDGEGGWVHENMLSPKNYVIAKEKTINLREGPGTNFAKRFVADQKALFEVVEEKDGWLRLKYADGDEGWCSAKVVWGWLPE